MRERTQKEELRFWNVLAQEARHTEERIPGVAPFRQDLEEAVAEAASYKAVRDGLERTRYDVTRRMWDAFAAAAEAARRLRCYVKAELGSDAEELKRFGVAPRRPRTRAKPLPLPEPPR